MSYYATRHFRMVIRLISQIRCFKKRVVQFNYTLDYRLGMSLPPRPACTVGTPQA